MMPNHRFSMMALIAIVLDPMSTGADKLTTATLDGCSGLSVTPATVFSSWIRLPSPVYFSSDDGSDKRIVAIVCSDPKGENVNDNFYFYIQSNATSSYMVTCDSLSPARCCPATIGKITWFQNGDHKTYTWNHC